MSLKKIPMRMCLGCQEMKPKRELIRVVKNKEGLISIDKKGKAPGRGAYICNALPCLEKAQKQKKLERAFGSPVEKEIYEQLVKELTNNGE